MPQDSQPPDPPSAQEVAEAIEGEPLINDRHADVRHALQDIVLFAQDFMDVLDDLVEEPIVPLEIFFLRPDRPAGRFAGPGRRHPNIRRPAGQPYHARHGLLERRLAGGNFRGPQRLQRPPVLLGRPVQAEGNLEEPVLPGQPPGYIPREQIPVEEPGVDEPREGNEPIRPAEVEEEEGTSAEIEEEGGTSAEIEEEGGTSAEVDEQGTPVKVEEEQGTPADVEEEHTSAAVEKEHDTPVEVDEEQGTSGAVEEEQSTTKDVGAEQSTTNDVGAEQSTPADVEAEQSTPADVEAEHSRPFAMEVEAAGSVASRVETGGLNRSTPREEYRSPEQVKRARLDMEEVRCSEQNKENVSDDKPMEVE